MAPPRVQNWESASSDGTGSMELRGVRNEFLAWFLVKKKKTVRVVKIKKVSRLGNKSVLYLFIQN